MKDNESATSCQEGRSLQGFPSSPCDPGAGGEETAARRDSLLHLYNNNSIEQDQKGLEKEKVLASCGSLTPYHKRQAHTLYLNADRFVSMAPSLDYIGFLTITTPDNCTNYKDLYRRWHSFNTNFLKRSPDFLHYLGVKERQQRGALHLHLLVQVNGDIRTGFDWDNYLLARDLKQQRKPWRKVAAQCYKSATPYLATLWPLLRQELPKYGFGRSELLPIRSSVEAVSRYVGGYLGKHISHREEWDKGMRVMFADRAWVKHSSRFQFLTEGSREWREKVALFAAILKCATEKDLDSRLGPKWCYRYREVIYGIRETWAGVENAPF